MVSHPYGPAFNCVRDHALVEPAPRRTRSCVAHWVLCDRVWNPRDHSGLPLAQLTDIACALASRKLVRPPSLPSGLKLGTKEYELDRQTAWRCFWTRRFTWARRVSRAFMAFKRGDFSVRLPEHWTGIAGKIADTFNDAIRTNQRMTQELERIVRVVGKEGRIMQRASLSDVSESWSDAIGCINVLIEDLLRPTSEMARVIGAVAKGDLSETMATEIEGQPLKGEFLRTAKTVNAMVEQLGAFASEVTRVAREVGTEGKLGGQAKVKGVAGTWKDLTDNVNLMASNLTSQVRNIAAVTTAVANGH